MKVSSFLLAFYPLLLNSADGFTVRQDVGPYSVPALNMAHDDQNHPLANRHLQNFGAATLATLFSFNIALGPASASDLMTTTNTAAPPLQLVQQQPSFLVADAIKTMDMSMPSSYGSLTNPKASVESVKDLTIDTSKAKKSSDVDPMRTSSSGGAKKMAGSYSAGPTKADKKKADNDAKRAAREKFEKENLGGKGVNVVDMSVPSYDQSTAQKDKGMFAL